MSWGFDKRYCPCTGLENYVVRAFDDVFIDYGESQVLDTRKGLLLDAKPKRMLPGDKSEFGLFVFIEGYEELSFLVAPERRKTTGATDRLYYPLGGLEERVRQIVQQNTPSFRPRRTKVRVTVANIEVVFPAAGGRMGVIHVFYDTKNPTGTPPTTDVWGLYPGYLAEKTVATDFAVLGYGQALTTGNDSEVDPRTIAVARGSGADDFATTGDRIWIEMAKQWECRMKGMSKAEAEAAPLPADPDAEHFKRHGNTLLPRWGGRYRMWFLYGWAVGDRVPRPFDDLSRPMQKD